MFHKKSMLGILGLSLLLAACQGKKDDTAETPAPAPAAPPITTPVPVTQGGVVVADSAMILTQTEWCLNLQKGNQFFEVRLMLYPNQQARYSYRRVHSYRKGQVVERGVGTWQVSGNLLTWTFPFETQTNAFHIEQVNPQGYQNVPPNVPTNGYPPPYQNGAQYPVYRGQYRLILIPQQQAVNPAQVVQAPPTYQSCGRQFR